MKKGFESMLYESENSHSSYILYYRNLFFMNFQNREDLHVFVKFMKIFTFLSNSWRSSRFSKFYEDLHVFVKFMKIFTFYYNREDLHEFAKSLYNLNRVLAETWRSSWIGQKREDLHEFVKNVKIFMNLSKTWKYSWFCKFVKKFTQ